MTGPKILYIHQILKVDGQFLASDFCILDSSSVTSQTMFSFITKLHIFGFAKTL